MIIRNIVVLITGTVMATVFVHVAFFGFVMALHYWKHS